MLASLQFILVQARCTRIRCELATTCIYGLLVQLNLHNGVILGELLTLVILPMHLV